jgi:putative transposase
VPLGQSLEFILQLCNANQIIVVENLHVKGMVRNRKHELRQYPTWVGECLLISYFYKLKAKDGQLVEVGRFFPSSKTCSCCGHVVPELMLDIRECDCPSCGTHHDRDGNAALNIRNEGIRILSMDLGTPFLPCRGNVRPINRKVERLLSLKPEAYTDPLRRCR